MREWPRNLKIHKTAVKLPSSEGLQNRSHKTQLIIWQCPGVRYPKTHSQVLCWCPFFKGITLEWFPYLAYASLSKGEMSFTYCLHINVCARHLSHFCSDCALAGLTCRYVCIERTSMWRWWDYFKSLPSSSEQRHRLNKTLTRKHVQNYMSNMETATLLNQSAPFVPRKVSSKQPFWVVYRQVCYIVSAYKGQVV